VKGEFVFVIEFIHCINKAILCPEVVLWIISVKFLMILTDKYTS